LTPITNALLSGTRSEEKSVCKDQGGPEVKSQQLVKTAARALLACGVMVLAGMLNGSSPVRAQDNQQALPTDEATEVEIGLRISPVPLNLAGKNLNLVGLGSYIVNAVSDCNSCHNGGQPPNFNYAAGGNPYFGQPQKTDPTVYMSGGQDFGPAVPPATPGAYAGPDIISRNLTPDRAGLPEGGHTLAQFKQIIRTGIDLDHLHPTCTQVTPTPEPLNCIPAPVDGNLLQVMPWPTFSHMTDHDLDAIYEYLSAIPCIEGPADPTNPLHNDCG
jgi:hypothetical protein